VVITALFYFAGIEALGNPNSLGAVMGVVVAPVLLWGTLLKQEAFAYRRRMLLYALAMYLTFSSHARAGMLAAFISCGLLCVALRRYRLLAQGIGIIAILAATGAIVQPEAFSRAVSGMTSTVIFKGRDATQGVLSSRKSPWQDTIESIHQHFWFGTGFGTSDNRWDAPDNLSKFSTVSAASAEHGSSYLAITAWVGMLGILPFVLLLGFLVGKIVQTLVWMSRTGNPAHGAVPLAIILVAGLAHAFFEDWLFAPGYYLCVFYWSMAFVFVDLVLCLKSTESRKLPSWRAPSTPELHAVAPFR
jgi:O-antigen ligase